MERPASFEYSRGTAVMTWAEDTWSVRLEFRRCQQDRKTGDVSAELLAFCDGRDGAGEHPLHRTRFNLTATRTQKEVANALADRLDGVDWTGRLGEAAWAVTDAVREGEPAILLRDAVPPPAGGAIVPPVINAADPTVLFGDGGTAKSYVGLAIALSIHSDRPLCGLKPARRLRTALLDFEWTAWPHQKRLRRLWGPGTPPDLVYVPCQTAGPLSTQLDRLSRILREREVEYVVLDSVALACAGPPEESGVALDFFQSLAQLEVGALLIAHVNRNADTWKPFGSTFWHNSARATWFIEREQGEELRLTLRNRKVNDGKLMPPVGLSFTFGDELTEIKRVEVAASSGANPSVAARIAGALAQQQPQTYAQLASSLALDPDVVRMTVRRDAETFLVNADKRSHTVSLRVTPPNPNTGPGCSGSAAPSGQSPTQNPETEHPNTPATPEPEHEPEHDDASPREADSPELETGYPNSSGEQANNEHSNPNRTTRAYKARPGLFGSSGSFEQLGSFGSGDEQAPEARRRSARRRRSRLDDQREGSGRWSAGRWLSGEEEP